MANKLSRRAFLKGGMAAACTLAATQVPAAASSDAQQHLATLIDIRNCIGCEKCVDACRTVNAAKYPDPKKPFPQMVPKRVKTADWSEKRDVQDRLTPYNWLYIQRADVTVDGEEQELTIPRRCMHCSNPPCVKLCPWGAAKQYQNGISRIDSDICLGGSKCKSVCPWDIPQRQTGVGLYLDLLPSYAGNGVMYKCDRCYSRVAEGKLPACIEACPEEVQTIGPRDQIIRKAHEIAKEDNAYIYGENENGGTNTLYISPVPFGELNQAIEKGKGMPNLAPAENAMAQGNNLAAAMLIAPLAGAAAAVGRFYRSTRKGEDQNES